MYVNLLSTYSDKKSCHTSTTLQTSTRGLSAIAKLLVPFVMVSNFCPLFTGQIQLHVPNVAYYGVLHLSENNLNQVFKVSSGTCQQFVEDAVKISNIFGFSTFTRLCSNISQVEIFVYVHREFSCESVGKRIMKIGPHLSKLLSNVKWLPFFWDTVQQKRAYCWHLQKW